MKELLFENEIEDHTSDASKIERKSADEESSSSNEEFYDSFDENESRMKKSNNDESFFKENVEDVFMTMTWACATHQMTKNKIQTMK